MGVKLIKSISFAVFMAIYDLIQGSFKETDGKGKFPPTINPLEISGDPVDVGVFTTIMIKNKVPVFLREHLKRFFSNISRGEVLKYVGLGEFMMTDFCSSNAV